MSLRRAPACPEKKLVTPADFNNSPLVIALRQQNERAKEISARILKGEPAELTSREAYPGACEEEKIKVKARASVSEMAKSGKFEDVDDQYKAMLVAYWEKVLSLSEECNNRTMMEEAKTFLNKM